MFSPSYIQAVASVLSRRNVPHVVIPDRRKVRVPAVPEEDRAEFEDWALSGIITDPNDEDKPLVLYHGGGGELDDTDWWTPDIRNTREFGHHVHIAYLRMSRPADEEDLCAAHNKLFGTNYTWDELLEDEDREGGPSTLADFLEVSPRYFDEVRRNHDGFVISCDDTLQFPGPSYRVFDIDDVWVLGTIST